MKAESRKHGSPPSTSVPHSGPPAGGFEELGVPESDGGRFLAASGIAAAAVGTLLPPQRTHVAAGDGHVVLVTLSGTGKLVSATFSAPLLPNALYILPTGTTCDCEAVRSWRVCRFLLSPGPLWDPWCALGPYWGPSRFADDLHAYALAFLRERQRGRPDGLPVLAKLADLLAFTLTRELRAAFPHTAPENDLRLRRLWEEVRKAPARKWSVPSLARLAGVSVPHLQGLVSRSHACGTMQMVTRIRMERAAQILCSSPAKLPEVARRCGYADPFSLSRAFKRVWGLPPDVFRKHPPARGV